MKKFARSLSAICALFLLVTCFSPYASAASQQAIADYQISQFLADKELSVQKLNETAQLPAIETVEYALFNGSNVTVETRELKVSDELTIVNTRTITSNPDDHTIKDTYGLFWGGIAGAAGELTAYYDYTYTDILSPNYMKTQIYNAGGYGTDIDDDEYKLDGVRPTWDSAASHTASGSVTFLMQSKIGIFWQDLTYVHTCEFDSYGLAHMSWG